MIVMESLVNNVVCLEDLGYFSNFYSFFCYFLVGIMFILFFCLVGFFFWIL